MDGQSGDSVRGHSQQFETGSSSDNLMESSLFGPPES